MHKFPEFSLWPRHGAAEDVPRSCSFYPIQSMKCFAKKNAASDTLSQCLPSPATDFVWTELICAKTLVAANGKVVWSGVHLPFRPMSAIFDIFIHLIKLVHNYYVLIHVEVIYTYSTKSKAHNVPSWLIRVLLPYKKELYQHPDGVSVAGKRDD